MSGFRGFGGRGSGGVQRHGYLSDPPLIKLVEDYLCENNHLSFVNLEHMGEVIRKKSAKFSRMKQVVFKDQLKKAYQIYCDQANESIDDFSGNGIDLDDCPLTEDTLKSMEGYPSEESSDSDIEIQEQAVNIARDAGVSQMKNLYMSNIATSSSKSGNSKSEEEPIKSGSAALTTNKTKSGGAEGEVHSFKDLEKADSVSVQSSTDYSLVSDHSANKNPSVSTSKVNDNSIHTTMDDGDESGSDLEIIEEVHNEKQVMSVIGDGSVTVSNGVNPNPMSSNGMGIGIKVTPIPNSTVIRAKAQYTTGMQQQIKGPVTNLFVQETVTNQGANAKVKTPLTAKKLGDQPNRGVKRKPTSKSGDEASFGINDDYTRKRPKKEVAVVHDTGYKLADFAGSEKIVEEICKLLMHLKHPEIYKTLGVTPPRGFLLHGPPGTGKTLLANAIAGELQMPMLKVAGTELVSGISGESESNIRELFNQALTVAPSIIFIDEIDSVTPRRENTNKDMERRIVAQLLSCIDDLVNKEKGNQVLLIGATNRIEAIDTALRRAGRFDREICLGIPDEKSREKILGVISRDLRLEKGFEIHTLARLTPGYVGADLQALVREAAVQAVNRKLVNEGTKSVPSTQSDTDVPMDVDSESANLLTQTQNTDSANSTTQIQNADSADSTTQTQNAESANPITETQNTESVNADSDESKGHCQQELTQPVKEPLNISQDNDPMRWIQETAPLSSEELQDLFITLKDFEFALKNVQPSSKREGFATVPDTTWDDIGALHSIRDELQVSILGPVKHAEAFKQLGLTTPAGVLLCGPPGCGKTLLAKAVANEAGINFISVKGPELLNMYVGESERAVRQCFLRAKNSSPCVIFFDELDALCPRRSDVADSGSSGRIVNQLLTEMDGMESRLGVFVMAATNRPDIIDPAIMRPGRLDKILFVNLPSSKDRFDIMKAITKDSTKPSLADDVNLEEIANCPECEDYTGADLAALVREASIAAFRELVLHPKEESAESCPLKDLKVYRRHFSVAFTKTKPSVGKEDRKKYQSMAEKYSSIH